jgi:molybdopterin synthase catalytic subunit
MNIVRIQNAPFDAGAEIAALTAGTSDVGAVVTFTGHVRGEDGVVSLTLEHYPGMTEREIARHVAAAQARWPLLGTTIVHRIGTLSMREAIVLVAVASRHRDAAFAAAEFLMDYLKARAPFWKQEHRNGEAAWVEGKDSDAQRVKRWT